MKNGKIFTFKVKNGLGRVWLVEAKSEQQALQIAAAQTNAYKVYIVK